MTLFSSLGWRIPAVLGIVLIAAGWFGYNFTERYFVAQTAEQNKITLRIAVAGLRGELRRYQPLPALIADKALIRHLLEAPENALLLDEVNHTLKNIAETVSASDVYVLDASGLTLAASNFEKPNTFIGRNYSFRPYFKAAMKGELGRYFAFGIASFRRGYYFSYPVREHGQIVGVVVVKINVDDFESVWQGSQNQIAVTDSNGIIFMSNRKDWHFKSLQKLSDGDLAFIGESRQYPLDVIEPLGIKESHAGPEGTEILVIDDGTEDEAFIVQQMPMREAGWTVHIFSPLVLARAPTYVAFSLAVLSVMLVLLAATFLAQRRTRLMERIAAQREAQDMLENRVAERTDDLNKANKKLREEIEERRAAEGQLRRAQSDLVQASKLAALGQMSAALSHEFNQPLSAVKSYADNAATLLDRERVGEARSNITHISALVDRMAAISKHLRNFARKPQEKIGPIPVAMVVNDAIEIMSGKLKSKAIQINIEQPGVELWAVGGQVRLQQVLVNLISNSLDAMADHMTEPSIDISTLQQGDLVRILVRDHGPGLRPDIAEQIFDPFFTTKGISKGLGLGLSISYNIIEDFGGRLSVYNHPEGGAVMSVELKAASRPQEVAAE
ncbi:MAG: sensor histidine kinase [Sneathiella sp.]|nr:MAG: sensor histidine kinase [Sneathiella sp.]